ncbi:MAG: hypothetical protein ACRD8O_03915 [Bryobacteraceae bacterium]
MTSALSSFLAPLRKPLTRRQSILLVFCCTLIGAAAQVFMKIGANRLPDGGLQTILADPLAVALNLPLLAGLTLYGVFTVMLILALRDGELSILYPVIAMNYVWVTVLSLLLFRESMNVFKALGIVAIVIGVIILGRSGSQ